MTRAILEPVDADIDPRVLRDIYGQFPSGVAAVCALVDGSPVGMAVSSFTSVSVQPPLVSVCIANTSTTWPVLRAGRRLGVSVLGEAHEEACRRLAARTDDRFRGLDLHVSGNGAVLVDGAPAWLDCSVEAEYPAGDHTVVLLRIAGFRIDPRARPLIFHRSGFRQLVER
ncbi:MAG TPA: flavin reductase family protein [Pseudonocardia sp.]|uniref:flavin reductase family protein n=1 Tax=Pseudonocardia sp. TaxID=60912 RepID=UPI002BA867F0|nr:flavin reductase family protein [Pseudonocardia sp.]HTF47181.1 flavin reductase family protein [Pseudonocardia sp.]